VTKVTRPEFGQETLGRRSAPCRKHVSTCWGRTTIGEWRCRKSGSLSSDATRGQDFEHCLRDFNNLPTTTLADIKRVLRVATDRVKSPLKSK
jgi:hypothetical protein